MTVRIVHRPARSSVPADTVARVILAPPPTAEEGASRFSAASLLPLLGSLSSIIMMLVLRSNPVVVIVGAVVLVVALVGTIGMSLTPRSAAARQRRLHRERYLAYLEQTRERIRTSAEHARDAALRLHPAPPALIDIATDPARRWERRPGDPDFLVLRIGTGDLRVVEVDIPADQDPVRPADPFLRETAERMGALAGVAQGMPATLDLASAGHVSIVGPRHETLPLVRALLVQLAAFHSPADVAVAALVPARRLSDWRGLDLLPHLSSDRIAPGCLAARRVAPDRETLLAFLAEELRNGSDPVAGLRRVGDEEAPRRLIVIADDDHDQSHALPPLGADLTVRLGVTVVHLVDERLREPPSIDVRVTVAAGNATIETPRRTAAATTGILVDTVTSAALGVIARPLTGLRLSREAPRHPGSGDAHDIARLLGGDGVGPGPGPGPGPGGSLAFDPALPRESDVPGSGPSGDDTDFLRVPIGVDDRGAPVLLDLKEAAQLGMGPHGICVGATGSGKSELLRTLVLRLALGHSPDDLAMILVDYKGGAAFAPFARLPHVAGIIDNLADDPQLTERARASLQGEVMRRQRLLKEAGNVASIAHYRRLRQERPNLPALPHLFLAIDEFGELLTAEPAFVDLLLTIGRIGRSIGVHLLLSSQRIESGRLRGLDTYLSYRIGLRTFSSAESTAILDTPDAFHLPPVPGFGFLKVDTSIYTRFRAGYVSGPVPPPLDEDSSRHDGPTVRVLPPYDVPAITRRGAPRLSRASAGPTVIDAATERLARASIRTRPVWLPPLPAVLTLGGMLAGTDASGGLRPPIGLLDDPTAQAQTPWSLDLTRSGGHVSITGAPQAGRSTFLRTLAASLAFTHSPHQVSIYGLDLTGAGLARIEPFPHVGGVATRGHGERVTRLLEELTAMLATRERVFRHHGLDSVADMRRRHTRGQIPELPSADVVLLVDDLGAMRRDFEDLEPSLARLLERGGSFGIHVVVTLSRWNDLRVNLQGLIGTRLELKLNDPADSQIARALSSTLTADRPGRVLTPDELFAQIALPLLEESDGEDIGEALERLARESARRWPGQGAAPIRLLPERLAPREIPAQAPEPDALAVGVRQDTMGPVILDLAARDPHLIVLGDGRCGKTTVLRGIARTATARYTPDDLVVAVMDARGGVASEIPDAYLGGHASSGRQARLLAESIAVELEKRQGDRGAGPRILVLVDDLDMLSAGGAEPLRPLLPSLASARDSRLNLVVSRPVAGAARAMFDATLQGLRDTGATVLVMSGERSEGAILPGLVAEPLIAGRGRLHRRGERPTLVQIAAFSATDPDAADPAAAGEIEPRAPGAAAPDPAPRTFDAAEADAAATGASTAARDAEPHAPGTAARDAEPRAPGTASRDAEPHAPGTASRDAEPHAPESAIERQRRRRTRTPPATGPTT